MMTQMPSSAVGVYYSPPSGKSARPTPAIAVAGAPPCLSRYFVEFLFYLTTGMSLFQMQTGLYAVRFAGGGPIVLGGVIAFLMMLVRQDRIPMVLWFAVIMNLGANASQGFMFGEPPLIGALLPNLAHWFANLAMVCFIVQNNGAWKRLIIVLSLFVLVSVKLAGWDLGAGSGESRISLEEAVTGSFVNANSLAYLSGCLALTALFWSLTASRIIRPLLWALAAVLSLVVIRTVSRGAMLDLGCGIAALTIAVLLGRGVRLSGIIVVLVVTLTGLALFTVAGESIAFLEERFEQESSRVSVYSIYTLRQMFKTMVFGRGMWFWTTAGIPAHNSYIYTHMTFGGVTAFPYAILLIVLGIRCTRLMFSSEVPLHLRMWVVTLFGFCLVSQMMSNLGYVEYESVFAFAVIDRFTAPYSRRAIAERRTNSYQYPYGVVVERAQPQPF